jgi:hypothetical protein
MSVFQSYSHSRPPPEANKNIELPPATDKITLIFDLDETLIHTEMVDW